MSDTPNPTESAEQRSLPLLRALIDAVDHELLQLLARRNELVTELAATKRHSATPIRDPAREAALLADRREHAARLGLSPEVIESVFRLVLWASRDRQAALKAAVPVNVTPKTVAIIGGSGGMGRSLGAMFGELGHTVLSADLDTELTPADAARQAEVVVISVPIDRTEDVIRALGPLVRPEGVLMDVTSVKTGPLQAMLEATPAAVVGTHPLFGPGVHSLQGQRVVLTRGRGDDWFQWVYQTFHARGLNIVEATAEQHDRVMAIVQVLVHYNTEVMGRTLSRLGVPIEETLAFTSPIYLIKMLLTARHFGQSADLYAGIEMGNPETARVTETFVAVARELAAIVERGDRSAFATLFDEVHDFFGAFTDEALEKSSYLIDRIVERT